MTLVFATLSSLAALGCETLAARLAAYDAPNLAHVTAEVVRKPFPVQPAPTAETGNPPQIVVGGTANQPIIQVKRWG